MGNNTEVEHGIETELSDRVRPLIMQALGQASLCWQDLGSDAVFDAALAVRVGDSLLCEIQRVLAALFG